jgi:hypothetical protein
MDTIELAKLLMQRLEWSYEDLARQCGIGRQNTHRTINGSVKTKRRDGFSLGVIAAAFRHGLEAEALSVILKQQEKLPISSVLRAAIMYPDLKPHELERLLQAEKVTSMFPLPAEVIRSIIENCRS